MFYQLANAPCGPSGLSSAISNIMRIAKQFGGPNRGSLDVLLCSWTLCADLAKQVIALGVPSSNTQSVKNQTKPAKPSLVSKAKCNVFKKKAQVVDFSPVHNQNQNHNDDQNQKHKDECCMAFWKALPTGEVLWNLCSGAEVLSDEDFQNLLNTAWGLFDDLDAIACLLGPVGLGRMRPKLDALLAMNLEPHVLGKGSEYARSQLQNAGVLLQQLASMCQADPRLARVAALFGVSLLAGRICSTANASVNFADGVVGSAVAQVNRLAAAIAEELGLHVEELLGGRKVECCLSSGEYKIVHAARAVANPLAEWHQNITAQVLAKATVKANAAEEEPRNLHPVEKALFGYSNLQGL